jgi:hypothetical protein
MKRSGLNKFYRSLLLAGLLGAGAGLVGCADEYAAHPGYHGGYYASFAPAPYPYYGGYAYPYRGYGPYYGGAYYGYRAPYYGSTRVAVSGSRTYSYRDRNGRLHTRRNVTRVHNNNNRTTTTTTRSRAIHTSPADNDDESRYYAPR